MPKTTKFSELLAEMSPEARAEARRLADNDLKEMQVCDFKAAGNLFSRGVGQIPDLVRQRTFRERGAERPNLRH